jgi:hypothetical protein
MWFRPVNEMIELFLACQHLKERERERERERNGTPKSNVFMSRSPVANPKSGSDYSVFIKFFFFNFTYPVRCFHVPPKMALHTPGVHVPQVEDHYPKL